MSDSHTSRTLKKLRDDGYTVAVVERWNPHARLRQDLFGFIDILALRGAETLAVQSTSYSHIAARLSKIAESDYVCAVREAGWAIQVWGWRKVNHRWQPRIVDCS